MDFFDTTITEYSKQLVRECLDSERVSEGEMVARFEDALKMTFDYKRAVTVNSGTSALHLALVLAGVQSGDEVILPAQTFVATGLAILYQQAIPVFCDIEMETGNIDVELIKECITLRTKAVIAVAWGGLSPRLSELRKICDQYGLKLIVDNAHALGVNVEHEDFSCFSFQAIKQLTTGDGGLVVCKSSRDYERAKRLKWFGIDRENDKPDPLTGERVYNLQEVGYKYHMNDISAALGLGNLNGFQGRQEHRRVIAEYYEQHFHTVRSGSMDWLFTTLVEHRDSFVENMQRNNIPVSVVHLGIHKNKIFHNDKKLPVQEVWDKHHICLPIHSRITLQDAETIVDVALKGW